MSPPPERGPPGNEGSVGMAELSIPEPQRLAEPHTGPADAPSQRKGFPKGFPSLFPTLRVNNASSTKCTFWGTPDTRTGRKHPTPDMEPLLGKGCFQNLLSTTPASPQSFYFRPETWNGRTEKHAQSRRPPPRCAQERGGRGRWAPEARRRARRRLRVWGDWVLGGRALGAGGGVPYGLPQLPLVVQLALQAARALLRGVRLLLQAADLPAHGLQRAAPRHRAGRRAGCGGRGRLLRAGRRCRTPERPAAPPSLARRTTAAPPAAPDQPGSRGLPGSAGEPRAGVRAPEAGTAAGAGRAPRTPGICKPREAPRMLAAAGSAQGAPGGLGGPCREEATAPGILLDSRRRSRLPLVPGHGHGR